MIPHNMPLFKFICALYQFHHQTLPIMKIDQGQIQFRDYVFTGTEPYNHVLFFHRIMASSYIKDEIVCLSVFLAGSHASLSKLT